MLLGWGALAAVFLSLGFVAEQRHVLLISVDGLMPAHYVRADELGLKIPNIRALMERGAWAEGVSGVLPTVTYPSHTTMITGALPSKHGIVSNKVIDPSGTSDDAWMWFAEEVRVPTLVDLARSKRLRTASVWWPATVGLPADWIVPEFWRSDHPADRHLLEALSTPGLIADAAAHRGSPFPHPWTDQERVDLTRFIIETYRPHLTLLHIFETDSAQHEHGPMSAEALQAVEEADARIGQILQSLQRAGIAGRTLVIITSDHGFLPVSTSLRPNVLLQEAGLIRVDDTGKVADWDVWFQADGGSAALVLRDPSRRDLIERVRALLPGKPGIHRILDVRQAAAMGSESPLVLDAERGFSFSSALGGEWSVSTSQKGTHGFAPDRHEMQASLIMAGPDLQRGSMGTMRMTDIAPLIARFLGLPPPSQRPRCGRDEVR